MPVITRPMAPVEEWTIPAYISAIAIYKAEISPAPIVAVEVLFGGVFLVTIAGACPVEVSTFSNGFFLLFLGYSWTLTWGPSRQS